MRIVVFGTSVAGTLVGAGLAARGHSVASLSPRPTVDVMTGVGLTGALSGSDVVLDASHTDSPAATANIVRFAEEAGVRHLVFLSHVNAPQDPPHLTVASVQEQLVVASDVPHSIVRVTVLFEGIRDCVLAGEVTGRINTPDANVQPIAATEVAALLGAVAIGEPLGSVIECAGPERGSFADFAQIVRQDLGGMAEIKPAEAPPGVGANGLDWPSRGAFVSGLTIRQWLESHSPTGGGNRSGSPEEPELTPQRGSVIPRINPVLGAPAPGAHSGCRHIDGGRI